MNLGFLNTYITYLKVMTLFVISVIIFVWLSESDIFYENMLTYAPAEIHGFDNSLYTQDIDVSTQETELSPRIGAIFIMSSLMKMGFSYEHAHLFLFFFACSIVAAGGVAFVYLAGMSNKLFGIILYTIIVGISRIHYFAGYYLFTVNSTFIGLGGACGIVAVLLIMFNPSIRRLNMVYLFVALAAIFHIHEGVWAFGLVSFIYLCNYKSIPYKILTFYFSVVVILALTIPVIISGTYRLPNADFFDIYVQSRIPHHLLVSYLEGWRGVLYMAVIYSLLIWINRDVLKRDNQLVLFICLFMLYFFTIAIWYVSSEIMHIPVLVKLYFAKFVKYISIPFSFLLIQYIYRMADDEKLLAIAMIFCLFVDREEWIWIMFLIHIAYYMLPRNTIPKNVVLGCVYSLCIMFFIWQSHMASIILRALLVTALLLSVLCAEKRRYNLDVYVFTLLIISCFSLRYYKNGMFKSCTEYFMYKQIGKEVYNFAKDIQQYVPKDEIILSNSTNIMNGYIQHVSRRSMYALWKTVPSSDLGIKIWYDRIDEIQDFCDWKSDMMASFMKEKKLKYLCICPEDMSFGYMDSPKFMLVTETQNYQLYKLQ